jgi:hypothetical protein
MFQDSTNLLLSTPFGSSNFIKLVSYCNDSSIAKTALSIDTSNVKVGIGKNPLYELDVVGDINFTGRILQNGFEFINGPVSSNEYVSSFQVVPVTKCFLITSQTGQVVFELDTTGNYLADASKAQVMLNGVKLVYIDTNNKDYTISVTHPTAHTTRFTITLVKAAVYGDVVDITVWPYIEDLKGVFLKLENTSFTSNLTLSNIGIGVLTPQYPFHASNVGSSNWLMGLENSNMQTLLCHSDGKGIRIYGSNVNGDLSSFECINGSKTLFCVRNDGLIGMGTSNLSPAYTLNVIGAINATESITSSSDARLKTNIQPLQNALTKIRGITGYSFEFKSMPEKQHIGLLAQEVEQVQPELVTEDTEGMKSIAYGNLIALLVEAIKEQQKQIEDLKKCLDDIPT